MYIELLMVGCMGAKCVRLSLTVDVHVENNYRCNLYHFTPI